MDRKVLFVILISVLAGSIQAIVGRVAYTSAEINPLSYSMNVLLVSLVVFTIFTLALKEPIRNFPKPIWTKLFILAIFATTIGMGLYYIGLNYTTAINTAMFMRLQAPFAALFAFFILGDKLTKRQIWATILMLVGAYFILFGFGLIIPNFGDVLMISTAALFGFCHSYYKKELSTKVPIFTVLFYRSVFGVSVLALLIILVLREASFQALMTIPFWVILQAVGYSVYMYGLYYGIKEIGPGPTTIFYLMSPMITIFLAFIVLGETIVFTQALGVVLIMIGAYLIIKNK